MTSYFYLKNLPEELIMVELEEYLKTNQVVFSKIQFLSNNTVKVFFSTAEVSIPNLEFVESTKFKE